MNLSEKYRPKELSDVVGQQRIAGQNGIIDRMLDQNDMKNVLFYGPPGTGKTTTARIIAEKSSMPFESLNATNASLSDIRKLVEKHKDTTFLLYLDEIQYFNKKQQQSLLPYTESGEMILIGATTENPYYSCYDALLSRCMVLEFKPVGFQDLKENLQKIITAERISITDEAVDTIASESAGDVRRSVNLLEMIVSVHPNGTITKQDVTGFLPSTRMSGFDTDGDNHYSLISALQKSIRGSDPNAAVFYLARLLEGGDILSPCRRLLVIANEDIGLANPEAITIAYAATETAKQLGLPEANKPLTNLVIYLALSPKASTAETAYNNAAEDVKRGLGQNIPYPMRHACAKGYVWPHAYPNHFVHQQYLPDDIKDHRYYVPEENSWETQANRYWDFIKKNTPK